MDKKQYQYIMIDQRRAHEAYKRHEKRAFINALVFGFVNTAILLAVLNI